MGIVSFLLNKKIEKVNKVKFIIATAIRISLLIAFIGAVVNTRWTIAFVSLIVFILTYSPYFVGKRYKLYIPPEFEIITILFLYASLFLGEIHGYYTKFWWWDVVLHSGSALAFGYIGFALMYMLYKGEKIKGSYIIMTVFSFSFAVAIGAVWEVFEFGMDSFFGMNMQKSGLVDTMWDIIVDITGAFIASLSGLIYLKKGESFFFDDMIEKFEKENPKLFK
jgi:hypothetical protein